MVEADEFRLYYRGQVNAVRGEDSVYRLSLKLQQSFRTVPLRAFLMGHAGVGKSTEISRLLDRVKDQHAPVRLSIVKELNPASFRVFDVLLLMLARLAGEADRIGAAPVGGISDHLVADIEQWFGTEQVKRLRSESTGAGVEAGLEAEANAILAHLRRT